MWIAARLGVRNLRRRPRRTALTGAMLLVSTTLLVFSVGSNEGSYAEMVELATQTFGGQLQVQAVGYEESPSLHATVADPAPLLAQLDADTRVSGASARAEAGGLLGVGVRSAAGLVVGVDPIRERSVTRIARSVTQGAWLDAPVRPGTLPIVLGAGLARNLRAGLGAEVAFVSQATDGSVAAELYTLVGILETGAAELDASAAFVRLADLQAVLLLGTRVHRVLAVLHDIDRVAAVARDLRVPDGTVARPWQDLLPGLAQSIDADRAGGRIFLAVIVIVVVLGSTNTLLMSVLERTRELGVMMAIGTTPRRIISITLWESGVLSFVAILVGTLIGVWLNAWLGERGLKVTSEPIEFGGASFDTVHPRNVLQATVVYPSIVLCSTLLAGLWPAFRAARLNPVAAIRQA